MLLAVVLPPVVFTMAAVIPGQTEWLGMRGTGQVIPLNQGFAGNHPKAVWRCFLVGNPSGTKSNIVLWLAAAATFSVAVLACNTQTGAWPEPTPGRGPDWDPGPALTPIPALTGKDRAKELQGDINHAASTLRALADAGERLHEKECWRPEYELKPMLDFKYQEVNRSVAAFRHKLENGEVEPGSEHHLGELGELVAAAKELVATMERICRAPFTGAGLLELTGCQWAASARKVVV